MSGETTTRRVVLDFSPDAYGRLLEIQKKAEAPTNDVVVRDALRLYEWYLQQRSEGYQLQLAKGDEVKAVEIIF